MWTVEAGSHVDAMTKYYAYMGWGEYATEHEWDYQPYPEEWARVQQAAEGTGGDV